MRKIAFGLAALLTLLLFANAPDRVRASFPDQVCTWADGDPLPVPGASIKATCTFPFWGVQQTLVVHIANLMDYDIGTTRPYILSCKLNGEAIGGPDCSPYYGNWTPVFKLMLGQYASKDSSCSANPATQEADPITLVIRMIGEPFSHLYEHGLPANVDDDPLETVADWAGESPYDYFYDNGDCVQSEIVRGSNVSHQLCWQVRNYVPLYGECLRNRWHVRGHLASLRDPEYRYLSVYALTPHYDRAVDDCGDQAPLVFHKHIVEQDVLHNGTNYSGYSWTRDRIWQRWINSGHHGSIDWQFWDNRGLRQQCNGETPRADGYVAMVGVCTDLSPSITNDWLGCPWVY